MKEGWVIGVDVSKAHLDACATKEGERSKEARFTNDEKGIRKLLKFARGLENLERIGMEATGGYELDLATCAYEQGCAVSVLNPRRVKDFARAKGGLNKTDRVDARVIALFLVKMDPSEWKPAPSHIQELLVLTRQRQSLLTQVNRCENQLSQKGLTAMLVRQIQSRLALVREHLMEIDEARMKIVGEDASLSEKFEGLTKIQGVGQEMTLNVLAEAGDVSSYPNAQSYAAASGLNPKRCESGSFRGRTAISKEGNAHLRAALYMPASVASRHNPVVREFKERLLKGGKTKMQARIACMRKLLMICYGVLKAIENGKTPYYGKKPA